MPLSQTPQNIFSRLYRMGIWDICELVLEILCFTVHAISLSLNTSVSNSWRNLLQLDHLNFIISITIWMTKSIAIGLCLVAIHKLRR